MFLKIIVNQARQKWVVTVLLLLAMTALVSLYVYIKNSARFSNRSMQIIMKNMGHNVLILPANSDPGQTHLCGPGQTLFSDTVTRDMAQELRLASKYYLSMLQERNEVNGKTVVLTGIEPVSRRDETREKRNLVVAIKPGRARLGSAAAEAFNVREGETITIMDRSFHVDQILSSQGTIDDSRVYIPLAQSQQMLNKPGKINAILAFLCLSYGPSLEKTCAHQDKVMARRFPGFRTIAKTNLAQGRYLARMTTTRYLYYLLGIVLAVTVALIVVAGVQEVSERIREVGILLAMGAGYSYIVSLYIVKLLVLALLASTAGFFIGSGLSKLLLVDVLTSNTRPISILWNQMPSTVVLTCAVAISAEVIPMIKLVRMDPNAILVEE